jgi:hypothetical protein
VRTSIVACGVANILGNKGATGVSLIFRGGFRLLLVNCHLAAHAEKCKERNEDFQRIRHNLFRRGRWVGRLSRLPYSVRFFSSFIPI